MYFIFHQSTKLIWDYKDIHFLSPLSRYTASPSQMYASGSFFIMDSNIFGLPSGNFLNESWQLPTANLSPVEFNFKDFYCKKGWKGDGSKANDCENIS